jgi:prevent-host-death family protein
MRTFSATDAKNNFGSVLDAVSLSPVRIEKNSQPYAVIISAQDFSEMENEYAISKAKSRLFAGDSMVIETLTRYSNAEISSIDAANKLELKFHGQLLDLLGMTDLPFPSLPDDRIDLMIEEISNALL